MSLLIREVGPYLPYQFDGFFSRNHDKEPCRPHKNRLQDLSILCCNPKKIMNRIKLLSICLLSLSFSVESHPVRCTDWSIFINVKYNFHAMFGYFRLSFHPRYFSVIVWVLKHILCNSYKKKNWISIDQTLSDNNTYMFSGIWTHV